MPKSPPEMKPGLITTCAYCRFFAGISGTCRFNPPVRLPRRFAEHAVEGNRVRDEALIWGWPQVDQDDWCGKWKLAK